MLTRLGYRNLLRNRRRTLLTGSAMAAATFLVIITLGINDGWLWDMIDGATELYHGHAKATAPEYRDQHRPTLTLPDSTPPGVTADDNVLGFAPRMRGFALLSFGSEADQESHPAELLGIDPALERNVTVLHERITSGRFLQSVDGTGIVLGAGLARRLNAELGGDVPAMGQGADGSISQMMFRVEGIVETGDPSRDAMFALVGLQTMQSMMVLEGQVHEWVFKLERPLEAADWATIADGAWGEAAVIPWQEIVPVIAQYLNIWDQMQVILALIFYFAVTLVAANTMSMSFFERIREFAVMGAIGLRPARLSRLIVWEGFVLSAVAALVGGALGTAASYWMFYNHIDLSGVMEPISFAGSTMQPRLRCYPTPRNILLPIGLIMTLGVLVALFPAMRLRRLKPVEALSEV